MRKLLFLLTGVFCFNNLFAQLPIDEDFESYVEGTSVFSDWTNDPLSALKWEVGAGATISTDTGPSDDASGGGKYIFMESSGSFIGSQAVLELFADLSGVTNAQLTYAYHMFGAAVGSLVVMANGVAVDSIIGQQQTLATDPWEYATVDLSDYDGIPVTIQLIGTVGSGGFTFTSDIALDDLSISEAACDSSVAPTSLNVNVTATDVEFNWDPIIGSVACQINGGPIGTFALTRTFYGADISMGSLPLIAFDSIEYNWRVRCACELSPSTIATMFSAVDTFDLGFVARLAAVADLGIAPNPVKGYLKLSFNSVKNVNESGDQLVQVIDLLGRVLYRESIEVAEGYNSFELDLNKIENGNYFLLIGTAENQIVKQFEVLR